MNPKPPECAGCPAADYGIGFVPPTAPTDRAPRFAFIGQGPGEQEAHFGVPFYPFAPSGRTLRAWIAEAGGDERDCVFGNVVCCWLPKVKLSGGLGRQSRAPTEAEAAFCYRAHWRRWVDALPDSTHLFAVGAPAARFLLQLTGGVEHLFGITHRVELPEVCSV